MHRTRMQPNPKRPWPERTAPAVESLMAELRELREQNDAKGAGGVLHQARHLFVRFALSLEG
jgi:hypothetical protein